MEIVAVGWSFSDQLNSDYQLAAQLLLYDYKNCFKRI